MNEAHQALDAGRDTKDHLAHEAADLLYHLYVLLASADVTPAEVYSVLERRHGAPSPPEGGRGRNPLTGVRISSNSRPQPHGGPGVRGCPARLRLRR